MQKLRASLEQLDQVIDTLEQSMALRERQKQSQAAELADAVAQARLSATQAHQIAEEALQKKERQSDAVNQLSTRLDAAIAQLETILKE